MRSAHLCKRVRFVDPLRYCSHVFRLGGQTGVLCGRPGLREPLQIRIGTGPNVQQACVNLLGFPVLAELRVCLDKACQSETVVRYRFQSLFECCDSKLRAVASEVLSTEHSVEKVRVVGWIVGLFAVLAFCFRGLG